MSPVHNMKWVQGACAFLALVVAAALGGCGSVPVRWSYAAVGPAAPVPAPFIRVAVKYPEEGRPASLGDDDHTTWGHRFGRHDAVQRPAYALRYVFGRALLDEVRASKRFAAVDWNPPFVEHYDVIIESRLVAHATCDTPGFSCTGADTIRPLTVEVRLVDAVGRQLATRSFEGKERFWPAWAWCSEDTITRAQTALRALLADVLPWVARVVDDTTGLGTPRQAEQRRARRYWLTVDPRLADFGAELTKRSQTGSADSSTTALARAYALKVAILESLRRFEVKALANTQETADRSFEEYVTRVYEGSMAALKNSRAAGAAAAVAGLGGGVSKFGQRSGVPGAKFVAAAITSVAAVQVDTIDSAKTSVADNLGSNPAFAHTLEASVSGSLKADLEDALKHFADISGTVVDIRQQWLRQYRDWTPSLADVTRGRWPSTAVAGTSAAGQGAVLVRSQPEGADVFINGSFMGNTPTRELRYPVGTQVEVVVRMAGYREYRRAFVIPNPNAIELRTTLELAPSPPTR
jgi:hypothetical protein